MQLSNGRTTGCSLGINSTSSFSKLTNIEKMEIEPVFGFEEETSVQALKWKDAFMLVERFS